MLSAQFFVIFKNFLDQINSVMLADDLDETLHFLRDHSVDHFFLDLKWYQWVLQTLCEFRNLPEYFFCILYDLSGNRKVIQSFCIINGGHCHLDHLLFL